MARNTSTSTYLAPLLFSVTLFTSAGLLFWIQPLIAKTLLPLWGGTVVCAFQPHVMSYNLHNCRCGGSAAALGHTVSSLAIYRSTPNGSGSMEKKEREFGAMTLRTSFARSSGNNRLQCHKETFCPSVAYLMGGVAEQRRTSAVSVLRKFSQGPS